jgi:hypothetical protein
VALVAAAAPEGCLYVLGEVIGDVFPEFFPDTLLRPVPKGEVLLLLGEIIRLVEVLPVLSYALLLLVDLGDTEFYLTYDGVGGFIYSR